MSWNLDSVQMKWRKDTFKKLDSLNVLREKLKDRTMQVNQPCRIHLGSLLPNADTSPSPHRQQSMQYGVLFVLQSESIKIKNKRLV